MPKVKTIVVISSKVLRIIFALLIIIRPI